MIYNVIGMRRTKKGFTLVELIIVMSIIAIFGGMTLAISVTGNLQKGRDGRRRTDLEAIRSAMEIYRSDNGKYPVTGSLNLLESGYITKVPTDPKAGYVYAYSSGGTTTYTLCAAMEKMVAGDILGCSSCGVACTYKVTNP